MLRLLNNVNKSNVINNRVGFGTQKADELEKAARLRGIQACYNGNDALAEKTDIVISRVSEKGYSLPPRIVIDREVFDRKGISQIPEWFDTPRIDGKIIPTVYLNSGYDWEKPVSQDASTRDPLHPIIHGFGHAAHYEEDPDFFVASCASSPVSQESREEVSGYAKKKKDAREFVAEKFAGDITGRKFSKEVDRLYDDLLHGPQPGSQNKVERVAISRWEDAFPV